MHRQIELAIFTVAEGETALGVERNEGRLRFRIRTARNHFFDHLVRAQSGRELGVQLDADDRVLLITEEREQLCLLDAQRPERFPGGFRE